MPNTPYLGIPEVSASQNQKEITINDAIIALEAATNAVLTIDYTGVVTYTLTGTQATRNMIFKGVTCAANCDLVFPIAVGGNTFIRTFVVRNDTGHILTVKYASGGGTTVAIPNAASRLIGAIDGVNMIIAAEPATVVAFTTLTDVPGSYATHGGQVLAVKSDVSGLEFITVANFPAFAGNGNKVLACKNTEDGVEWVPVVTNFLALTDAPHSYASQARKLVAVNASENALEFIDLPSPTAVEFPPSTQWRIRTVTAGVGITQIGWGEIELRDVDGINRATGGTPSASSFDTGREPTYAFDGNTSAGNGYLSAPADVVGSWIKYTFATAISLRSVKLYAVNGFPTYAPTEFIIERWNGTAWINCGDRIPATWVSGTSQTFAVNGDPITSVAEAPNDANYYARHALGWSVLGNTALLNIDTDGALAANSDTIIASQKATRSYVDAKLTGLSWKQAVRAASTANGALATAFANGQVIDGVTLVTGDRILIKFQSTGSDNGIYTVAASGAPARATDADSAAELVNATCYVSEGSTLADTQWTCTTNAPITLGTTALSFAQLTSGGLGSSASYRAAYGAPTTTYTWATVINPYTLPTSWSSNGVVATVVEADAGIGTSDCLTFDPPAGLGNGANRTLTITFTTTTIGDFSMRYRTQGESGFDGTSINIDGTVVSTNRSADSGFVEFTQTLAVGNHTVIIAYSSDSSTTSGYQNVRISRIILPNAAVLPYQFGDIVPNNGKKYVCLVAGTGAAPLASSTDWAILEPTLVAGSNVTITNNGTDSLTIAATGSSGGLLAANNLSDLASASTARSNLGATTVGSNLLTTANPSAIKFPRVNADNSVSLLDAAPFLSAIGGSGSGGGTASPSLLSFHPPLASLFNLAANGTGVSATLTDNTNYLSIVRTDGGAAGERLAFRGKAVPAGSAWTVTVGFLLPDAGSGERLRVGLALRESSTGKMVTFINNTEAGSNVLAIFNYNGADSYGSSDLSYGTFGGRKEMFLRVALVGTNYVYSVSWDYGIDWEVMATVPVTTRFTTAANQVGISIGTAAAVTIGKKWRADVFYYSDPDFVGQALGGTAGSGSGTSGIYAPLCTGDVPPIILCTPDGSPIMTRIS
jgi:hypothetical protein